MYYEDSFTKTVYQPNWTPYVLSSGICWEIQFFSQKQMNNTSKNENHQKEISGGLHFFISQLRPHTTLVVYHHKQGFFHVLHRQSKSPHQ